MLGVVEQVLSDSRATDEQKSAATLTRNSLRSLLRKANPADAGQHAALIRFNKLIGLL